MTLLGPLGGWKARGGYSTPLCDSIFPIPALTPTLQLPTTLSPKHRLYASPTLTIPPSPWHIEKAHSYRPPPYNTIRPQPASTLKYPSPLNLRTPSIVSPQLFPLPPSLSLSLPHPPLSPPSPPVQPWWLHGLSCPKMLGLKILVLGGQQCVGCSQF